MNNGDVLLVVGCYVKHWIRIEKNIRVSFKRLYNATRWSNMNQHKKNNKYFFFPAPKMSFFRRAQSKVFYGNSLETPYQSIYSSIDREIAKTRQTIVTQGSFREERSDTSTNSNRNDDSWNSRQGSPSSHKSQVRPLHCSYSNFHNLKEIFTGFWIFWHREFPKYDSNAKENKRLGHINSKNAI